MPVSTDKVVEDTDYYDSSFSNGKEKCSRNGQNDEKVPCHSEIIDGENFSDTTLQRRLEGIDIETLRGRLYEVIKKSNRRKVIVGGKVIFTTDGTSAERAYRKRCPLCHETERGYIRKDLPC